MLSFSKNKETNDSESLSQNPSTFISPRNRDRDLDYQIDVLNNLNLEIMETKWKSNLSNIKPKEFSKLTNDETIVIKPTNKRSSCSDSFNKSLPKHDYATFIGWKYIQKARLLHQQQNTEWPFKISKKV